MQAKLQGPGDGELSGDAGGLVDRIMIRQQRANNSMTCRVFSTAKLREEAKFTGSFHSSRRNCLPRDGKIPI